MGSLEDVTFVKVGLLEVPNPNAVAAAETEVAPVPPEAIGKAPVTLDVKSILPANWAFVIVPAVICPKIVSAVIEPPRAVAAPAIVIELLANLLLATLPVNWAFVILPAGNSAARFVAESVAPKEIAWEPIVTVLLANLALAIVLSVICAFTIPDASLLAFIPPAPIESSIFAVVTAPPREVATPAIVIELLANLLLAMLPANWAFVIPPDNLPEAIEPANISFVTLPVSPVVKTVPVVSGNVIVRSAVGSVTANVVSKAFSVAPSIVRELPVKCNEDDVTPWFTVKEPACVAVEPEEPIVDKPVIVVTSFCVAVLIVPSNSDTTSIPGVIVKSPVAFVSAVVNPITNLSADSSIPINAFVELPLSIKRPASLAGVPEVPFETPIKLSVTSILVVLMVVVVPFTVKLPVTVALPPTVKLLVTDALSPIKALLATPRPPVVLRAPLVELVLCVALVTETAPANVEAPLVANVVKEPVFAVEAPIGVLSIELAFKILLEPILILPAASKAAILGTVKVSVLLAKEKPVLSSKTPFNPVKTTLPVPRLSEVKVLALTSYSPKSTSCSEPWIISLFWLTDIVNVPSATDNVLPATIVTSPLVRSPVTSPVTLPIKFPLTVPVEVMVPPTVRLLEREPEVAVNAPAVNAPTVIKPEVKLILLPDKVKGDCAEVKSAAVNVVPPKIKLPLALILPDTSRDSEGLAAPRFIPKLVTNLAFVAVSVGTVMELVAFKEVAERAVKDPL